MGKRIQQSHTLRSERLRLALLLALHVINSLAWCAAFPLWQGADEAAHFSLVQYIAETGRLPGPELRYRSDEIVLSAELSDVARLPFDATQRQMFAYGPDGPREAEIAALDPALRTGYEREAKSSGMTIPPLYHAGAALLYRLAYSGSIVDRAFAVRLFSILLSTAGVAGAYLLARQAWPRSPGMGVTMAMWVSLQPEFSFLVGAGNTDVLINLCYTALLFLMVRAARRGLRWTDALGMGVALGCGLLVKPVILFAGPAMAMLWLYAGWRKERRTSWGRLAAYAALIGALVALLWGWWAVRSLRINNSLFYDNPWVSGASDLPAKLDPNYPWPQYVRDHLLSLWEGLFTTYWGNFAYNEVPVAPAMYNLWRAACVLSAVGLGVAVARGLRARRRGEERATQEALIGLLLAVTAIMPILAMGYYGYRHWRQLGTGWPPMGRYFLGPLAAQMGLLAWGLLSLLPRRWRPYAHPPLRLVAWLLNAIALIGFVLPRYYL
jgi:4-amino-4-deoxy-L-arabinose transferase-like glycosyltransferase